MPRRGAVCGRFNAKGIAALYVATSPHTAIREANQVGDLQPTTIVAYDSDIDAVFDTRDPVKLARFEMTSEALADPRWRDQMTRGAQARTQAFAKALMAQRYNELLVRSFARGDRAGHQLGAVDLGR
ncbi:RES domain-containing protein [Novosphingobium fluoreni]|uniref:RES domain-containing protein n=1 Tax=Novosphingobium fluoreni TaxID=1391222 RepID=A0A7W6FZU5_9SPHN|nr:RES domain-containing protein [Novosphingobium fluoreni]